MAQAFTATCRGLATNLPVISPFKTITVVGAGLMGTGIAQVAAQSGQKVTLVDVKKDFLKKAQLNIATSLQRVGKKLHKEDPSKEQEFVKTALENLTFSLDVQESVKTADLVVEAIVEILPAKQTLFTTIDLVAPDHTVFASNTSSLSITEIASGTNRKDKFAGLHFFNPVPVMKLLEVVRTEETSQETYEHLIAWGNAVGKTCVICKDTPGFIVNRLLVPYVAEAVRMMERGVATPSDIDTAMKLGAGHPMGPFELADYTGLDTAKYIMDGWHQNYPDEKLFRPVKTVTKLVAEGKFGMKTGEGFYKYKK